MARDRVQSSDALRDSGNGSVSNASERLRGIGAPDEHSGTAGGMAGAMSGPGPASASHSGLPDASGTVIRTDLEGLFTGGFVAPPDDSEASKRWPTVQLCMRATLTTNGQPRAGGEVKTVAAGPNYVTTLTMPEEGRMLRVAHEALSAAWDALELALRDRPIPWVQCSDFAKRRAKIKQKPENRKLLDPSEKR